MSDEKYWHYEQCVPGATKPCPHCGKNMVTTWDSCVMTSSPPQQRWYWYCFGCHYQELAGIHCYPSEEDKLQERWEAANKEAGT